MNPDSHLFPSQMKHERKSIHHHIQTGHSDKDHDSAIGGDPVVDAPRPDPCHGGLETGYSNHEFGGKL